MIFKLILIAYIQIIILSELKENCSGLETKIISKNVLCYSSLTQNDCKQQGKYIVTKSCPECQGGNQINESCNSKTAKCAPGLKCTNKCVLDKTKCSYTYHLPDDVKLLPICKIDETFAAVQCKGDRITGRCFCYFDNGNRIFGWSWWKNSQEMTCVCSRLKYKLENQEQKENTLHCDQMGNFEPLQCTNGVCWCANSTTGEILHDTIAVPDSMWLFLPCYESERMDLQYMRQCESVLKAQYLLRKALISRGTIQMEFNNVKCDFDGAFGIYSTLNGITSCQWRDGAKLSPYQMPSNLLSTINCNCARDQKIFAEAGLTHQLTCEGNGNYKSFQDINGKGFCIDRDGYAVNKADEANKPEKTECKNFIYYEVEIKPNLVDYSDNIY